MAHKTIETTSGKYYAAYKANRNTNWYILFDIDEDCYIVRNLIHPHTPDYPKINCPLK